MELKLNAKDLIKVIQTCRKSGVRVFECGSTKIVFSKETQFTKTEPSQPSRDQVFETEDLSKKMDEVAFEGSVKEQIENAEDVVENLLLEDPEKFEDMLAAGEFDEQSEQFEQTEEAI